MKGLTEAHTCRLSSISTVLTAWLYVSDLFLLRCTLFKLPQLSRSTINILVKTATLVLIILGRAVSIFTGKKFLKSEFPPPVLGYSCAWNSGDSYPQSNSWAQVQAIYYSYHEASAPSNPTCLAEVSFRLHDQYGRNNS